MRTLATTILAVVLAVAAPARAQVSGAVETQAIASQALGEGRAITVYRPPGWRAGRSYPVIYMADGQAAQAVIAVLEPMIVSGKLPPVLLVGVHAADDGQRRHLDYLPRFDGRSDAAFERHMRFFLGEVMPLAERRYGASALPQERLLLGFSDGASWAIATALRRPRLFGKAAGLSLGWPEAGQPLDGFARPKFFLGAGTKEGVFRSQTQAFANAARSRGYNVRYEMREGVHGQALWTPMYADVLTGRSPRWASARRSSSRAGRRCPG